MPITFRCNCGQKLQVADRKADQVIRCPKCQGMVDVPAQHENVNSLWAMIQDEDIEPEDSEFAEADSKIRFRCGNCGKSIEVAKKHAGLKAPCPRCQVVVSVPGSRPKPTRGGFDWNAEVSPGRVLLGLVAVFVVLFVVAQFKEKPPSYTPIEVWKSQHPAPRPSEPTHGYSHNAVTMAKQFVRQQLKYPHDASFPWGSAEAKRFGDVWRIKGLVKAKNGFGAELTHKYFVIVERVSGGTWECKSVSIQ